MIYSAPIYASGRLILDTYLMFDQCTQQTWAKMKSNIKQPMALYLKSGYFPSGTVVEPEATGGGVETIYTNRFNDAGRVSYALGDPGYNTMHTPSY
jgi:hypothetical protein